MIVILTKARHCWKLMSFLTRIHIVNWVYAVEQAGREWIAPGEYSLGISYCWPYLVPPEILAQPSLGWINYHPAPLPDYKGPKETTRAIADRVMEWGVSVHWMDERFDTGPLIECRRYSLWEPPTNEAEMGAVAHWHLFQLFRDTIKSLTTATRYVKQQ